MPFVGTGVALAANASQPRVLNATESFRRDCQVYTLADELKPGK